MSSVIATEWGSFWQATIQAVRSFPYVRGDELEVLTVLFPERDDPALPQSNREGALRSTGSL